MHIGRCSLLASGRRRLLVGALLALMMAAIPASAIKVYVNPSVQTANVSPDGLYNEGNAMQNVASRLMSKLTARGLEARNSAWLSLSAACADAVSWDADLFIALHTNAAGGGGWSSARGTEAFYYQSSSQWNDPKDIDLANRCAHKCVEKFNAWGRGYDRGTFADWPYFGYNLYVLANTPGMYSTLVEGLFHTNQADTAVLLTDAGKDAYAQAIFEAVCDFYGMSYSNDIWGSTYSAKSFPTTMVTGKQATCWVEYKNTGNTTWSNTGANPVKLATWNPQDRVSPFYTAGDWPSSTRPTVLDSASCAPNATGRFTFVITAPQQTGTYSESWRLVSEGNTWFGDSSVNFTINVVPRGHITGRITNAVTGAGISGAKVSITTSITTTTDGNGSYALRDLDLGTYTLSVSRVGFESNSARTTVTSGATTIQNLALLPLDGTVPSTPTDLVATGVGPTQVQLTWNPSTDDSEVTGYMVFRDGIQIATAPTAAYLDTGLSPMTAYSYQVRAFDPVGNQSDLSDAAVGKTGRGPMAVFTDGFETLDSWQGDPDASSTMALDSTCNHGTLPGANSAKATAGQPQFMYHEFSPAFTVGKYEAWLYDADNGGFSREAIQLRGFDADGNVAYSFYVGNYPSTPGTTMTYSAGVYNGSAWTWAGQILYRTKGWHKFAIEVLPYTGTGDVKFYIDDVVRATLNRPAGSNSFGFSRLHIGYKGEVYTDGWFDDVIFTAQAPDDPTIGIPTALSPTSIRWGFADKSDSEAGFRLLDAAENQMALVAQPNLSAIDEIGLQPNTSYTRSVQAFNGTLSSWPTDPATRCTLSAPPSETTVTCDHPARAWQPEPGFTFNAVGGFGAGKVQYYRFAFDRNPTHAWTGSEPVWSSGSLACSASAAGNNWYLHLQGYNAENLANGTLDLGPYYYGTVETFTCPMSLLQTGWSLIALPATPVDPSPTAVFTEIDPATISLQYWRNDLPSGGYQDYGEFFGWIGPMICGTSYWFLEPNPSQPVSFIGIRNQNDWRINIPAHPVAPYWVMIGHPFEHATPCSDIRFASDPSHPIALGWADAYRNGIIESIAQGYDGSKHAFVNTGPGEFMVERDHFEPWYGYWLLVRTTEPVTISIPAAP